MKQAPVNPNPTAVGQVINTIIEKGQIPVRIYIPKGNGPFPVITYFHRGGFVLDAPVFKEDMYSGSINRTK
jgi:acetyl esterase